MPGFTKAEREAMAARAEELVARHATVMDRHDPHKKVGLVFDEWGTWWQDEPGATPGFLYQQNALRDAQVAAVADDHDPTAVRAIAADSLVPFAL